MSKMLVKKNVLNEINKEGTFTQGFKKCRKIKLSISKLRRPSKLAHKINWLKPAQTVRESVASL